MGMGENEFEEIAEKRRKRRETPEIKKEEPQTKPAKVVFEFSNCGDFVSCFLMTTDKESEEALIKRAKKKLDIEYYENVKIEKISTKPQNPQQ
jgi:hypothetical protein